MWWLARERRWERLSSGRGAGLGRKLVSCGAAGLFGLHTLADQVETGYRLVAHSSFLDVAEELKRLEQAAQVGELGRTKRRG